MERLDCPRLFTSSHCQQAGQPFPVWVVKSRQQGGQSKPAPSIDPKEVLKAITQDYVKVTRVYQNSQWKTLEEPQSIRFGAVFVERAVAENTSEPTQAKKKVIETDETLLTVDQAAEYLKLKRNTLDKHRTGGTGPRYQHAGRSIRYRKDDLDNWDR